MYTYTFTYTLYTYTHIHIYLHIIKDMRVYLAKIDWNNTLKNKTATECWNILKSEIDCVVDKFIPLEKQGKRSKKKHLSKEATRKNQVQANDVEEI